MPGAEAPNPAMRSPCPIANALDLLGDKWTLLVIRDLLFFGRRRFNELQSSPEGIPTNILSDRLRRLEEHGVLVKVPYQTRPPRHEYHLTPKGADLLPIPRAEEVAEQVVLGIEPSRVLDREPSLADSGRADDRDEPLTFETPTIEGHQVLAPGCPADCHPSKSTYVFESPGWLA